jgi:hypothetical protein
MIISKVMEKIALNKRNDPDNYEKDGVKKIESLGLKNSILTNM